MTTATTASIRTPQRLLESIQLGFFLVALCAGNFSVAIGQIALGVTLLVGLTRWFLYREALVKTGMERVTLALIAWALLMIPFSADPGQSVVFAKRFFLFAALWLGAGLAVNEYRRRLMLGAMMLGAAGISVIAIWQMYQATGSLMANRLVQVSNAMTSGAMLMLVVLLALGVLLNRSTGTKARLVVGAALAPIFLALLMTMTRSALLGLMVGVAVMLLVAHRRWFLIFATCLVLLAAGVVMFGEEVLSPRAWSRISPESLVSGGNTTGRLEMWRVGWQMIQAEPITGVGDCDLLAVAPQYYGDRQPVPFGHLHSNFVHLAVIWGIPGFILAMVFLGNQPRLLWGRWRRDLGGNNNETPWHSGWVLGALGMWAGFFVAGLTEWYFGDAEPMLLFMAILGVALGRQLPAPSDRGTGEPNV
ncbi:MAG: O-antigen ligase family protein [Candidatus Krumholzibacteria bacterium]|nr:O-antigen ligase family protein [Candidatus Krumholzibacteria bacterium]